MLQILGLREFTTGKLSHAFFDQGWTAPGLPQLLANPDAYIDSIPEDARWNLFFTLHHCQGKIARDFDYQDVISFDIDDINVDKAELTAKLICETVGIEYHKTGVVFSGHGLQLHVLIETKITDNKYFTEKRELYKLIVQRINEALEKTSLSGKADPSVWSASRLMRLPNTWNRKPHKGDDVMARVLQGHMELQGFTLETACGAPLVESGGQIHIEAFARFPAPDTEAVLAGCDFLKWAKERPNEVTEYQWYAMLSITGRLQDGRQISHEYSKGHRGYSETETNFKLDQALRTAGPRTCSNIHANWGKCNGCKYFGSVQSPITIQGPDYIGTESTGFYHVVETKAGMKQIPAYEDLVKYYRKKKGEFVANEGRIPYVHSKETNSWSVTSEIELKSFAYNTMKPRPRSNVTSEFANTILVTKTMLANKMNEASKRKLNLKNGVYNLETLKMEEAKPTQYFMSHLPYEYDPNAGAPTFEKFMSEITCNDADLQMLLLEYMGYAISGDDYWVHKALILYGDGSNGKSTFNKVLKALVGPDSYSSLNIEALQNDQKRAMLEGKLFNLGDENNATGFIDASIFKALSAGEEVDIKHVYCRPYSIRNRAKLIFNCNIMPTSKDSTEGMLRRLLCVPFNAYFDERDPKTDPHIEHKLFRELPGILNLCIKGYLRLKEQQKFTRSAASEGLLAEYRAEVRDVDAWFDDYIVPSDEKSFVVVTDAFSSYLQKCTREGIKYPQSRQNFGFQLKKLAEKRGMQGGQRRVGIEKPRVIFGAKLVTGHTEESKHQEPY